MKKVFFILFLSISFPGLPQEKNLENKLKEEVIEGSWRQKTHQYTGYFILGGSILNGVLGSYIWDKTKEGKSVSSELRQFHRGLGYSIVGLSAFQSTLGAIEFWNHRKEKEGKIQRTLHMSLSLFSTALFWEASRNAYFGKYDQHKKRMKYAIGGVTLTIAIIIW